HMRCAHLGLKVPMDWQTGWIRVHDQILNWKNSEVVLFDDTYEHELRNDTDVKPAVQFIDIDRPKDRIGTLVKRLIVHVIQASTYVKQPLKKLAL
ncbi:MAG: aspartyl beta-hydroxylase, partial [Comamonadaceae bacterium CG_4_10_14_0_8_um_filter_57_29]